MSLIVGKRNDKKISIRPLRYRLDANDGALRAGDKEKGRDERYFSWCSFLWGFGWRGTERSGGERSEPQRSAAAANVVLPSQRDPEVVAKAKRRTFTAEYKLRILQEAESAASIRSGLGALQDATRQHLKSYAPERTQRGDTVRLWQKIPTLDDPQWTKWYHERGPGENASVDLWESPLRTVKSLLMNSESRTRIQRVHARSKQKDYIRKFDMPAEGLISQEERNRFIGLVEDLSDLTPAQVQQLNVQVPLRRLLNNKRDRKEIF